MDPSNQNKRTELGITALGLTIFVGGDCYNENDHLKGCVCPECPTYDKKKNEQMIEWFGNELP